jgi:hypothetical protein
VEPALGQDRDAPHGVPAFPVATTSSLLNGTTSARGVASLALPTRPVFL